MVASLSNGLLFIQHHQPSRPFAFRLIYIPSLIQSDPRYQFSIGKKLKDKRGKSEYLIKLVQRSKYIPKQASQTMYADAVSISVDEYMRIS